MVDVIDMAVVQRLAVMKLHYFEAAQHALDAGIRHFSKDGELLTTPDAIFEAFRRDGEVSLAGGPGAVLEIDDEVLARDLGLSTGDWWRV